MPKHGKPTEEDWAKFFNDDEVISTIQKVVEAAQVEVRQNLHVGVALCVAVARYELATAFTEHRAEGNTQ